MASQARVFVVHVWTDAGAFCARARAADAEEACEFGDPQQLLAFLRRASDTWPEMDAPDAPDAPCAPA